MSYYTLNTAIMISGFLTFDSSDGSDSFEESIKCLDEKQRLDMGCALQSGSFLVSYIDNKLQIEKSSRADLTNYETGMERHKA